MVVEAAKLVDMEHGLLDRRIFSDQEVYQQELEKIFTRAWLFIGHESLVPNPNDFFNIYMGEDPVILTRDAKGQLHAMLNMCRHRGNRVVRADDGNAKNFMCTYHGWTYSSDGGKLVSVPGLQEAYYGELDVDNLGLIEVAQLDTYAGFVFATWDPEAPSLEDWIGDARYYMDMLWNRRDGGIQMYGPDKWILPTNWKMPADNFGTDGYHTEVTHRSISLVNAQRRGGQPTPMLQKIYQAQSYPRYQVRGHSIGTELRVEDGEGPMRWNDRQPAPDRAGYLGKVQPEMERRHGAFRARTVRLGASTVFPNLSIHGSGPMVRLWLPRGPQKTEVWGFQIPDKAATQEEKEGFRRSGMLAMGIAGIMESDDADNWNLCVASAKSVVGRRYRQVLSMGLGHAEEEQDILPGYRSPSGINEDRQRGLYKWWQQFMDAESWADIPVYPPTATYEGTATFKG